MNIMVYITAANMDEAFQISELLVELQLAACANFYPIRSIYRWNNKMVSDEEFAISLKTKEEHFDRIVDEVKKIHSYEIPCIISYPIITGYQPYIDWINSSTQ
jgi:periplasmic divalent cation tolerance protein